MKKITIKGKGYPCRVTMGALLRYKRQFGKDAQDLSEGDIESIMAFTYCCVASACNADGVAIDVDFEQFCDCVDPEDFANFYNEEAEPQKKTKGKERSQK